MQVALNQWPQAPSTSISVTWKIPESLAGVNVNSATYWIQYCEKGKTYCETVTASRNSHIIDELTPGTEYEVTIAAYSLRGLPGESVKKSVKTGEKLLPLVRNSLL